MASQGREQYFHRILIFFAIASAIIAFFNLAASGAITIHNFGGGSLEGQTISGTTPTFYQEGANTANGTYLSGIDFRTATSVNPNITTEIGGPWTLTGGTGLVLSGLPILPGVINPSAIIIRNGQSNGQLYTTNALVSNPTGSDFYVFPRFITGYSGSDLKVVFSYDGIHIKKFPLAYGIFDNGDDYFFPLPDAQITLAGGSTITTQLIETVSTQISNTPDYLSTLTVTKDGNPLFTTSVRSILAGANINDQVRHGGAGADTTGFIVSAFPNTPILDTSSSIISGDSGTLSSLAIASNFLTLIGTIFGFEKTAAIPYWLVAIIFIPTITTMILIYLEMARGN